MITIIEQALSWLKEKAKQILIVLGIIGIAIVVGSQVILQPIPTDLLLECDKADVLETYLRGDNIEYAYKTNIKIPRLDNEVKRTNTTLIRLERDNLYKVKEGDSLDKIAKELIVDQKKIKGYQSKNPDIIYPNETLDLGSKQYSVESGYSQYFNGTDWYEVKFATTTLEMFNRQMISLVERVFAADTGYKSPSATGGKYNEWVGQGWNATDAYASDNNYAGSGAASIPLDNHLHQSYETFDFGVPGGATIDGIELSAEWYFDNGVAVTFNVNIYSASDVSWGTEKQIANRTTEGTDTVGASDDLWGRTPIDTDFSDANFSAYLDVYAAGADNIHVDHIQVKVYYTEAADEGNMFLMF